MRPPLHADRCTFFDWVLGFADFLFFVFFDLFRFGAYPSFKANVARISAIAPTTTLW